MALWWVDSMSAFDVHGFSYWCIDHNKHAVSFQYDIMLRTLVIQSAPSCRIGMNNLASKKKNPVLFTYYNYLIPYSVSACLLCVFQIIALYMSGQ